VRRWQIALILLCLLAAFFLVGTIDYNALGLLSLGLL
jgi:hypothetical protein